MWIAPIRSVLSFALLSISVVAQATWIVDANQGAGANFTTLRAAFAQAKHRDTVLVRAGAYLPATCSKGIRLVGEPGALIAGAKQAFEVRSVPVYEQFTMQGFGLSIDDGQFRILNCQGSVHLEGMNLTGNVAQSRWIIRNCGSITLHKMTSHAGLTIEDSTVALSDVKILPLLPTPSSLAAVTALRSRVMVSLSDVSGMNGVFYQSKYILASSAFDMVDSRLVLSTGCKVAAGSHTSPVMVSAIVASNSDLEIDPTVPVTTQGAAKAVVTNKPVAYISTPGITASGGAPGRALSAVAHGAQGSSCIIALGLALPQVFQTPWGDLALHGTVSTTMGSGTFSLQRQFGVSVPVPALAVVRGIPLTLQAIQFDSLGLRLSPPATVILD